MPIAHVNGISLYYEDPGAGPPLVWVHGFACGIRSWDPQLRELRIPTLLIVGDHDTPYVKVHEFMARTIAGARSVVLPGIGHLSNLEAPAEFNAHVRRFLDEAVPAGARRIER